MAKNDTPIYLKLPKDVKVKFKKMAAGTTMTKLLIKWIKNG